MKEIHADKKDWLVCFHLDPINRQHLLAENLSDRLHDSLQCVVTSVNNTKTDASNDRRFKKRYIDNEKDYNHLLPHIEVRCLSNGASLNIFYEVFDSVL